ncbi:MAG: FtsW/RodA/SpoVE family cell cycle protein [Lewinellaceae bacterium]|nr:FtsW/RodA/SpoVE family cell cycle protein [Saprospiraceae bacterium]MCB9330975.1 FtsW/RodA/SpoVE family cell cycle protein [Lewinellaceae bacterium]
MSLGNRIAANLRGDRTIWMIVAVLSIISVLAVYSAAGSLAWQARGGNTTIYLMRHSIMLAFGLFLIYLCHLMHYRRYQQMAPFLLLISVPLLALTLLFGQSINQASRWIEIPILSFSFQPSDFAKLALILYIARALTQKQEYITSFKDAFLPIIVPVLIVCGLIAPANLSTALVLFGTCIALMFVGRVSPRYIFLLGLLGVVVFAGLIVLGDIYPDLVRSETWISRMQDYLHNPDGGYQVQQAKIAIARGGIFGAGPGNSVARNFLPYSHADFIYAIICEEYGLMGGVLVLGLYVMLFFRAVKLVTKSPKAFGAFLAIGLSLMLTIQALANIAVSVHLVPSTGLTLPMISMGGTSMVFTSIAIGMVLSVSKFIEKIENT